MIFRKVIRGSASSLNIVDHNESYGRHILEKCVSQLNINTCVDMGCGYGSDLMIIKKQKPDAELTGIDFGTWNSETLKEKGIRLVTLDIEKDKLPFEDESVDFIIANQILEHTKEIYCINHEIFRCLKKGGHFFFGTPNILSFHNRIMMAFGFHPTQHKLVSAHVRPFSKRDVYKFYEQIGNEFCKVKNFWGSQFYPFPKTAARILSSLFPGNSFSIFFLIEKTNRYKNEFIEWPARASLETNFYTGK